MDPGPGVLAMRQSTRHSTADRPRPPSTGRSTVRPPPALQELADLAGVRFNGDAPWDIQVHDPIVYREILTRQSLGFGESYMEGHWDCGALDELFHRLLRVDIDAQVAAWDRWRLLGESLRQRLRNPQSRGRAFIVGQRHYDIGNDVFQAMLDPSMSYSCAYWARADDLDQAQRDKLDLICRKLYLRPGERLLDVGCGWGGLAHHAARHYGVEVVGLTVSKEQCSLARERCQGLPVRIELMDYRDLDGERFDKAVSVGMFEHVGVRNYQVYFDTVRRMLRDDGLFLLHTIGIHRTTPGIDPWIDRYIFPNGKLPSAAELSTVLDGRFLIEDWHGFGPDYDRTLMAWWRNFDAAWPMLGDRYGPRFYRMWRYYLLSCAGFFRSRQGQLWQLVLSPRERAAGYLSVR
jgi:cyclopropane-fatty-acyl-phospholipid synthase